VIEASVHHDLESARTRGQALLSQLRPDGLVRSVLHFRSVGSTNTLAREMARQGEPGGLLVLADEQTTGRGRLGRSFHSPAGQGLWFTLLLRPAPGRTVSPAVTLIAGVAVCEALQSAGLRDASVKWPNDILLAGVKVAGILAESGFDIDQRPYLVLGIGINLTNESFPPELSGIATSVQLSAGKQLERNTLLQDILTRLADLERTLTRVGFQQIRPRYRVCSSTIGREILLVDPSGSQPGQVIRAEEAGTERLYQCLDIADDGSLVLQDRQGRIFQQNSGEISLRYPSKREGNP